MPDELGGGNAWGEQMLEGWRHLEMYGAWSRDGELAEVWFQSLNQPDKWGREGRATCRREPFRHLPPEEGCRCGWYALKDPDRIRRGDYDGYGYRRRNAALARVRLWGNVAEARWGYRAEWQRIEDLEVEATCVRCGGDACGLGIVVNSDFGFIYTVKGENITGPLQPLCEDCADALCRWEETEAAVGVPVRPGTPYADTEQVQNDEEASGLAQRKGAARSLVVWLSVGVTWAAVYLIGREAAAAIVDAIAGLMP